MTKKVEPNGQTVAEAKRTEQVQEMQKALLDALQAESSDLKASIDAHYQSGALMFKELQKLNHDIAALKQAMGV